MPCFLYHYGTFIAVEDFMMFRAQAIFFSVLLFSLQAGAYPGFRQMTLSGQGENVLKVAVWYPASFAGVAESMGENAAFVGETVLRNAPPAPGQHPLLVLSHGYNGNWRNLAWLAVALAERGYIVAAPDHPGTTTFDQNPTEARKLWQRPLDITKVIDFVTGASGQLGETDQERIAAAGHSLGGWTVMELAGARFDAVRFLHNCQQHPLRGDCRLKEKLGIDVQRSQEKLAASYRDARIKAVISLDAGLAPGFTPQSLRESAIPVLILAAQSDELAALPASQESAYLADRMASGSGTFALIKGATHFSFMQLCKPGAGALLNAETPGDGIVCQDAEGASRSVIHYKLSRQITAFLNAALD